MKVAFDEHVPSALVHAFQAFANERKFRQLTGGLIVEKAKDHAPKPGDEDYLKGNDGPWIRRFAQAGGKIIITGDTEMISVPHERLALLQEKMIVIFFASKWSNWKFHKKCALLMFWWPEIVQTVKKADEATFWRVPSSFAENAKIDRVSTQDQKLEKIVRQRAAQPETAARRKAVRNEAGKQDDFGFPEKQRGSSEEPSGAD